MQDNTSPATVADALGTTYPAAAKAIQRVKEREGFRVLPGTTSDEKQLRALITAGADGMITDRPDVLKRIVAEELASVTDPETKTRLERFDIQGHRGARGLRPENTLPAYEEALDLGITTIDRYTATHPDI